MGQSQPPFVFLIGPIPRLFLLIFFFSNTICKEKNSRRQWESNSDRRSRRRARWPLDHHHGPGLLLLTLFSSIIISTKKLQTFAGFQLGSSEYRASRAHWRFEHHHGPKKVFWLKSDAKVFSAVHKFKVFKAKQKYKFLVGNFILFYLGWKEMRLPQSGKTLVLLIISQNIFYIKNNLFDHKTVKCFKAFLPKS